MKQSFCLFTIIAFVSFTSALSPKVVPTEFVSTTITTNNIATLKPDTTVTPNSTIITSTETPSTTTETTTTNPITTTTKPLTTTLTPNNNVTTTASPSPPAPSKGSYDSFSFFGGLLLGIIFAVAGLFAFKFYQSRDPSYQNL